MKKILIGCGVIFVIVLLALAVVVWSAIKMGKQVGSQMQSVQQKVTALNGKYPFKPAEGQLVEPTRLDTWLQVEQAIRGQVETLGQTMDQWGKTVEEGKKPSMVATFKMAKDHMSNMLTGVNALADSLDAAKMSLAEYSWTGQQVLSALRSQAIQQQDALKDLVSSFDKIEAANGAQMDEVFGGMGRARMSDAQVQNLVGLIAAKKDAFQAEIDSLGKSIMYRGMLGSMANGAFQAQPQRGGPMPTAEPTAEPTAQQTPAPAAAQ